MDAAPRQRWSLQAVENISRQYTDISWGFTAKGQRHSRRIGQLTMESIWSPPTIGHMGGLQFIGVELNGVELCGIHAIVWIKITCSRGRIMDLDL